MKSISHVVTFLFIKDQLNHLLWFSSRTFSWEDFLGVEIKASQSGIHSSNSRHISQTALSFYLVVYTCDATLILIHLSFLDCVHKSVLFLLVSFLPHSKFIHIIFWIPYIWVNALYLFFLIYFFVKINYCCCLITSVVSDCLQPYGLQPTGKTPPSIGFSSKYWNRVPLLLRIQG